MTLPVLAIDLGATNVRASIVDGRGRILDRAARRTPVDDPTPGAVVELARALVRSQAVERCVLGVAARIDYRRGMVDHVRLLPAVWLPALSEAAFSEALGVPVDLANDADLAAVGEQRFGAGEGFADVAFMTVSSGIGAGAVVGGRVLRGHRSLLEIGLMVTEPWPEAEPSHDIVLEDRASARALEQSAMRAGLPPSAAEVVRLVRAGNQVATAVWREHVAQVALVAVNLAHVLVPDVLVVGGGLSTAGELLIGPVRDQVARRGPNDLPAPIRVVKATLGDDAGLVGAAGWASASGYEPAREGASDDSSSSSVTSVPRSADA